MINMDDDDFLALRNFGPQKLDDLKSALGKAEYKYLICSKLTQIENLQVKKNIKKQNYDEVFGKNVQKISQNESDFRQYYRITRRIY